MSIKYNSYGGQFRSLKDAWNQNIFMSQYEQVNNPLYPFVYGNPKGYGTNTNPDPFFWGQPQQPKYCNCVQTVKTGKAYENYCSSCNESDYKVSDNLNNSDTHQSTVNKSSEYQADDLMNENVYANNIQNMIQTQSIKSLQKDVPHFSTELENGHKQLRKNLRTLQSIGSVSDISNNCKHNPNSPECTSFETYNSPNHIQTFPYGTSRNYGTGSIGNGSIGNDSAHVAPSSCSSSVMIGQREPVSITSMGGIDYSHQSPQTIASTWSPQKRRDFCSATKGGKKLAF